MNDVQVKEVIITNLLMRGDGKDDPIRRVLQVYDKDGVLIAEKDDIGTFLEFDLLHFGRWVIENQFEVGLLEIKHVRKWRNRP